MRVAVMQPYIFPYLPYFQLIHAVECFVILDTVQYLRQGWMNRNRIKLGGRSHLFSIPIHKAPQATTIDKVLFADNVEIEAQRLLVLLEHAYKGAPYWAQFNELVSSLFAGLKPRSSFVDFAEQSIQAVSKLLEIETTMIRASSLGPRQHASAELYIIDLCHQLGATVYVNAKGGKHLYNATSFHSEDIRLVFLEAELPEYAQISGEFVANLSVLDALANLGLPDIQRYLQCYQLEAAN